MRKALRDEMLAGWTEEERRAYAASEAVEEVRKKGRAYVSALIALFDHHADHLTPDTAHSLSVQVQEILSTIYAAAELER